MPLRQIEFDRLPWEYPTTGVAQKVIVKGHSQLRLLRFSDGFEEENWCTRGHVGYVLRGSMKIDFSGEIKTYQEGDGLWLEAGENSKHKVILKKNQEVELILFERTA